MSEVHQPFETSIAHPAAIANYRLYVLRGVIAILAGVTALIFPVSAVFVFAMMFAGWCIADGILALATAVKGATDHEPRWWTLILRGVLGLVVGVLFIAAPGIAALTYAMFTLAIVGAWALVAGALEIITAIRLRKIISGEWLMITSGTLSVILGVLLFGYIVYDPAATLLSAATIIGVYLVMSGFALLFFGNNLRLLSLKGRIAPL